MTNVKVAVEKAVGGDVVQVVDGGVGGCAAASRWFV